jgi:hypothetical protein
MKDALEVGEVVLLQEKAYRINDKGRVKESVQFIRFEQNVRFVFSTCAKVYGLHFNLDKQGAEWKALLAGVEVRNRLAHPKTIAHMNVSKLEIDLVRGAGSWFMSQSMALLMEVLHKEEQIAERRDRLASRRSSDMLFGLGLNAFLPKDQQRESEVDKQALLGLLASSRTVMNLPMRTWCRTRQRMRWMRHRLTRSINTT